MRRIVLALVLVIASGPAAGEAVEHDLVVRTLMAEKVNPAALAFWAGGNDPPEGETPAQAERRWSAALKGAQDLQAGGRDLLEHSRPGRWDEFARLMIEGGEKGEAAARARDMDAAFLIGGDEVYIACNGCHKTYVPTPARLP